MQVSISDFTSAYEEFLEKDILSSSPGKDIHLINPFTGKKEDPERGCEEPVFAFDFELVEIDQVESCAVEQNVQDTKLSRNQALIQNQRRNCATCATRF